MITTHTLLIIDDNITNLKLTMSYLKAYSYKILTASTGLDGVDRAQLTVPDLILLDVMMPDIDGFEVCARLKANPTTADIPVIFMTAISDAEHKTRGLREGAVDYVTKPVNVSELLMRVRTHLSLRDLQLQLENEAAQRNDILTKQTAELEKIRAERHTLSETVSMQAEQLHQLAQQAMQEHLIQNEGVRTFFQNQLHTNLKQARSALDDAQIQLHITTHTAPPHLQQHLEKANTYIKDLLDQVEELIDNTTQDVHITHSDLYQKLSDREYQTLKMMAKGLGNGDIAEEMGVSPGTVTTYRRRIMQKLGVSDTASLLQIAFTLNLKHEKL